MSEPFPTPPPVLTIEELTTALAEAMKRNQKLQDDNRKLRAVFTSEQVEQLTELCKRIQQRAVERGTEQSVTIIFNGKSWPVHFNGTDNEKPIRPTNYKAE